MIRNTCVVIFALTLAGLAALSVATKGNATPDGGCWSIVPSPNASSELYTNLYRVAVVSANDVWASGNASFGANTKPIVEHWDGNQWSIVPAPSVGRLGTLFQGIAALVSNDIWAVGSYDSSTSSVNGNGAKTLTEHWDGTQWNVVPSPNSPLGISSNLRGVAALSVNNVWAVGYVNASSVFQTLVEHWDGTQWTIVPSPNTTRGDGLLQEVKGLSPNDVWAVGWSPALKAGTLAIHWDGAQWSAIPTPNPGADQNILTGVAPISANDVWAVGWSQNASVVTPLTMHWDGSQWTLVRNPSGAGQALYGVTAIATNDVWAVGDSGAGKSLAMHWDGVAWSVVATPNPPATTQSYLWGIASVSSTDLWAVNFAVPEGGGRVTLVERFSNPCNSSPTPTPTPTPPPPGEDPCTLPGISILSDPAGDAATKQAEHDILKLSIAEPANIGPGKIMFILKMASMANPTADTTWPVVFHAPNPAPTGADYFVRMATNAAGTVTFASGAGTDPSPFRVPGTPADPASSFSPDGTIKIIVKRSDIGNPSPGQQITQFLTIIRFLETPESVVTPDHMPNGDLRLGAYTVLGSEFCSAVTPTGVVSRKTHGGAGTFDIDLPLTGSPGIECRSGGASGNHQVVLTFANPVSVSGTPVKAQVTSGTGTVSNVTVNGTEVTVDLTQVANAQKITLTLFNVSDGTNAGDVSVPMNVLVGDTNADGVVNSGDIAQTKSQSGQFVTTSNFREDVTADGALNSGDISLVKSKSGTALP